MIHVGHLSWDSSSKPHPSSSHVEDISSLQYSITSYDLYDQEKLIYLIGTSSGLLLIIQLLTSSSNIPICHILKYITPPMKEKLYHHEVTVLKVSPCRRYLAVGLINGLVIIFQLNKLENLSLLSKYSEHKNTPITALCWSIDSCKLFSGSQNGLLVEFNLIDGNPSIDVVTFAASFFGITKTLQIGDCKTCIVSIDYYFSPSEASLKSTEINPSAMLTSFLPYTSNTTTDTSSSGDHLLVCCSDYRVLQFRLFRNGTKQAKMMSLNIFVQRSQANLQNGINGNHEVPYMKFSFACYIPRSPLLSQSSSSKDNSLICLFSATSPEVYICDFAENSIIKITLKMTNSHSERFSDPISFVKVFVPNEPSSDYFVLTQCHRLGVINMKQKTFYIFQAIEKIHSFFPSVSFILYLLDVPGTNNRILCGLSRFAFNSSPRFLFPRSIHLSFSKLKERWKIYHQRNSRQLLSVPNSPLKSPAKSPNLKHIMRKLLSRPAPTFQSIEHRLQQNLNECDLLLERINLDVLDAMHMPTLDEIEQAADRKTLLPAVSPSLRSPSINYDHSIGLTQSSSDSSIKPICDRFYNDVTSPENLSYAPLSFDQSAQLLSLRDHFDVVSLSKKMFFRDFIQLLDSHIGNSENKSVSSCRYGEHIKLLRGKNDKKSDLQCLFDEVDELCLLSGLLTKTIEDNSYDLHCKYLQPNQKLLVQDGEIFQSFLPETQPVMIKSPEQLDTEIQRLLQKTNQILAVSLPVVGDQHQNIQNDILELKEVANFPSPLRGTGSLIENEPLCDDDFFPSDDQVRNGPLKSIASESDFVVDPDWIRNTKDTWLDHWLECPSSSSLYEMKMDIQQRRNDRKIQCNSFIIEDDDKIPPVVRDTYQVKLKCTPSGLGLSLNLNPDSILVVTGFTAMPLGVANPARSSHMIKKGDLLIGINDLSLLDFDQNDTIEVLKSFLATQTNEYVTLTFRYCDAICGNIKFSPPKVSVEDTVWRDTKDTTLIEKSLLHEIDMQDENDETEVEINHEDSFLDKKHKENPLFDIFGGLSTDVLKRKDGFQQVEEMSVLDVASALFTGSIDEIAFQSVSNRKTAVRISELLENEITARHLYPSCSIPHGISSQTDVGKRLNILVEDIWKSNRHIVSPRSYLSFANNSKLPNTLLNIDVDKCKTATGLLEYIEKELHCSYLLHQTEDYLTWIENRNKSERNIGSSKYDLLEHQPLPESISRKSTIDDDESVYSINTVEMNHIIFHDRNYQLSQISASRSMGSNSIPSSPIISKQISHLVSPSLSYFSNPSYLMKKNITKAISLNGSQQKLMTLPTTPDPKETHRLYELIVRMLTQSISPILSLCLIEEILKSWIVSWSPSKVNSTQRRTDKGVSLPIQFTQISLLVSLYLLLRTSRNDIISVSPIPTLPCEHNSTINIPSAQICLKKPALFDILQLDFSTIILSGLFSDPNKASSSGWTYEEFSNFLETYNSYLDPDVSLMICCRLRYPDLMMDTLHSIYTNPLTGKGLPPSVQEISFNSQQPAISYHELLYKLPKLIQVEPTLIFSIFTALFKYFPPWVLHSLLIDHQRSPVRKTNTNWYAFLSMEPDSDGVGSQNHLHLSLELNEFYLSILIDIYTHLVEERSILHQVVLYPLLRYILSLSSYLLHHYRLEATSSESLTRRDLYSTLISRLLRPSPDDAIFHAIFQYSIDIFTILIDFQLVDISLDLMANLLHGLGLSLDLTPSSLSLNRHLLSNYVSILKDLSSMLFSSYFTSQSAENHENSPSSSPLRVSCECLLYLSYLLHRTLTADSASWELWEMLQQSIGENVTWQRELQDMLMTSLGPHSERYLLTTAPESLPQHSPSLP